MTVPDSSVTMDPDALARIVLADADHVREWEQPHPFETDWAARRQGFACEVQRLLDSAETQQQQHF